MVIFHVCPSRSFSGLEQYVLQLCVDQKHRGHDVYVIASPVGQLKVQCEKNNIKVIPFDAYELLGVPRFWKTLTDDIKKLKPQILHLHSTQAIWHVFGAITQLKLFKFSQIPKVILQTHIWINHAKKDPIHTLLYKIVDQVWCSSTRAKEALGQCLPVDVKKIAIVNYGRDVKKQTTGVLSKNDSRHALKLPIDKILLGCVSRIEESKGIAELVQAFIEVSSKYKDIELAIIGGASPNDLSAEKYFQKIKEIASGQLKIHLLGPVTDSYKYLNAFDLYVLPSYEECFSLALLDAQLASLPVMGTSSGGTPEVVIDDKTGWLFEPRNENQLATTMVKALESRSHWASMGERASLRVRTEFDQEPIFQSVIKKYEELAKQ